jgi:hypothetical protein
MTFEELDHLLFERAEARRLLRERTHYRILSDSARSREIESEIAYFVLQPLVLKKGEIPPEWHIADAAQAFTENPDRSWASGISSSSVERWPQELKDRILTLCGSLDAILLRMRSKEQSVIA